jgi:hypothetical protein
MAITSPNNPVMNQNYSEAFGASDPLISGGVVGTKTDVKRNETTTDYVSGISLRKVSSQQFPNNYIMSPGLDGQVVIDLNPTINNYSTIKGPLPSAGLGVSIPGNLPFQ